MTNFLIAIVGATAIGKTAMSIHLAKHFNADIVSCDSRQFYKEMTIGTAVPNVNELNSAHHHFIQNRSIFDNYSVGQFEKDALETIEKLFTKNNVVVMVGGSGLYANAVIDGLDYFPEVSPEIRYNLNKEFETNGIEILKNQLKELDIDSFNSIEIENPHRLIRALEICIGTGKKYSDFKNKPKALRNFKAIKIGLVAPREIMYERINSRVDIMMEEGLLEEAKSLFENKNLNALQTVGYKELFEYINGTRSLDFAISEIKKNTRRFAKRQVTWNKKDKDILWFDYLENPKHIIKTIEGIIKN